MTLTYMQPHRTTLRRRIAEANEEQLLARNSAGLLDLQRTHGNQHVQRVVADGDLVPGEIQRAPKGQTKVTEAENALILGSVQYTPEDNLLLWKLAGGKNNTGTLNPLQINSQATSLLDQVKSLAANESIWQNQLDLLGKHEGKGEGQLAKVRAAAGKIGSSSQGTGGSGYYYRAATEGYIDATDEVKTAYEDMVSKQKAVDIAATALHRLSIEKRKRAAQEEESKASKDVADEKERIADEKKYLTKMLDVAKLVVNPTEWVDTAVDVVAFVGEQVIEKKYTTEYLGYLEGILATAQAKVAGIDDELVINDLKQKGLELEKATGDLTSAKKAFERKIAAAKRKETTVVSTLQGSTATRGAGNAISERGKVMETAHLAGKALNQWLADATKANNAVGYLDRFYDLVVDGIGYERTSIARNETEAKQIEYFSTENGKEIRDVGIWLNGTIAEARGAVDFITGGSYLKGYDDIPDALSDALVNRNSPAKKAKP